MSFKYDITIIAAGLLNMKTGNGENGEPDSVLKPDTSWAKLKTIFVKICNYSLARKNVFLEFYLIGR